MARPRVFISSTFYDLKQIRSDLANFIDVLGYDTVRNEEGEIPYGKDDALEEYCYKEIKSIDILISIIGGRFGSISLKNSYSISQLELKTALKENKQVYVFIEKNVLSEYETYLLNKSSSDVKYRFVDDIRIYQYIEEIKNLSANNNIKGFETASDITRYLKEQFAGLFQRFLEEQIRIKEVSLIVNLEKTAQTLNKLVNFLGEENKGHTEEINKILMINHPLVEKLRDILVVHYNFYIEGFNDMKKLLHARGFKVKEGDDSLPFSSSDENDFYMWTKEINRQKKIKLKISHKLFDKDMKLKFIKKSDWNDDYVIVEDIVYNQVGDDDLPF